MASLISLLLLPFLLSLSTAPMPMYVGSATPTAIPEAGRPHDPGEPALVLLSRILPPLGLTDLAAALPSLSSPPLSPVLSAGPFTLFAPSDASLRSCGPACSPSRLLREHLVPGHFDHETLSKLAFGTKLPTSTSPSRCLTVTSAPGPTPKIYVDGVEITRPNLYSDGRIVIHGISGFVAPLSPYSCNPDLIASLPSDVDGSDPTGSAVVVRVMLRDAIVRLRDSGFGILALAMRIKYPELSGLRNMTVFALDDAAIFGGGQGYVHEIRFHVIPNVLLRGADLAGLSAGTTMSTLVRGAHLVVTQAGPAVGPAATGPAGLRINFAPIKVVDVVSNGRIAVHSIYFPFPHLYLADVAAAAREVDAGIVEDPVGPGEEETSKCGPSMALAPQASAAVHHLEDGL